MTKNPKTTGSLPQQPLSTAKRLLFGGFAFAGTAVYAVSFSLIRESFQLLPIAAAIGIAAGVSWIGFGIILLIVTRLRPSIMDWADACLATMATGNAILFVSVAANVIIFLFGSKEGPIAGTLIPLHAAVLIAADIIMGSIFIQRSSSLGLGRFTAAALWIFGLNGLFALMFVVFKKFGVLL